MEIKIEEGIFSEIESFRSSAAEYSGASKVSSIAGLEACIQFKTVMNQLIDLATAYKVLIDKDGQEIRNFAYKMRNLDKS